MATARREKVCVWPLGQEAATARWRIVCYCVTQQRILMSWLDKNLQNTDNPRFIGGPLKGQLNEYWRYRIGNYRIILNNKDHELLIVVIQIGHRKQIYKN